MWGMEEIPQNKRVVLVILQMINAAMTSSTEVKLGALIVNAKVAVPMQNFFRRILIPPTPTPNTYTNQQLHSARCCQQQNTVKRNRSNIY